MSTDLIEQGNRLIAEFMGLENIVINGEKYMTPCPIKHMTENNWKKAYLTYHKSWSELMPVVERIESLNFMANIYWNYCDIYASDGFPNDAYTSNITPSNRSDTKIGAVYHSVLQFITWYNTNQNKQP